MKRDKDTDEINDAIRKMLKEVSLETTSNPNKAKCQYCGKEFVRRTEWQKFCSKECKWKAWDKKHPRK